MSEREYRLIVLLVQKPRKEHYCDACHEEIYPEEGYEGWVYGYGKKIIVRKRHLYGCPEEDELAEEMSEEIPLSLRPLVPLFRESEEEKRDDDRKEKTIGPI